MFALFCFFLKGRSQSGRPASPSPRRGSSLGSPGNEGERRLSALWGLLGFPPLQTHGRSPGAVLQEQEPTTRDSVALTRRCQRPWRRPEAPGRLRGSGPGYGGVAASGACGSAGAPQRGRAPRGHFGFARFPFLRRWDSGTSSAAAAGSPSSSPCVVSLRAPAPRRESAFQPPSRPPRRHLLP